MTSKTKSTETRRHQPTQFEQQAEQSQQGIVSEFVDFLRYNKRWWLAPIIIVLLIVGVLVVLSGTAIGPFIYAG